ALAQAPWVYCDLLMLGVLSKGGGFHPFIFLVPAALSDSAPSGNDARKVRVLCSVSLSSAFRWPHGVSSASRPTQCRRRKSPTTPRAIRRTTTVGRRGA